MTEKKVTRKPKGRQLKKFSMKVDNKEIMKVPKAITIGLDDTGKYVQMNIAGKLGIEEALDMLNNTLFETLNVFLANIVKKGANEKEMKKQLYERAVWGFSLIIDQFYPEGKESKFEGFTDKAIMEAQNAKLRKDLNKKAKKS